MDFVTFGKKKLITVEQQQLQQSQMQQHIQQNNENCGMAPLYQQQSFTDASTIQSIAHSDLESFRLAEADAEMVLREGLRVETSFNYEHPANSQREQSVEGEGISQLLEHNNALRKNFDNLKQLHLQLVEANAQLQEACFSMEAEKVKMEGGLLHNTTIQHEKKTLEAELEEMKIKHTKELDILRAEREKISGLAVELEQRNKSLEKKVVVIKGDNKELNQKLEVVRYGHDNREEKDKALKSKHAIELGYAQNSSLLKMEDQNYRQEAVDLAHKCKHLEIDLEKAISAGEAVHQQLVTLTYEKDATIMDLEQALRRLKDDLQRLEKKRKDNERNWQVERHKLQAVIDEKEREEYKLKLTIREEAELKLKESFREIVELRTLLTALEKSSAASEAQHLEILKETKQECGTLRKELGAALATQKETADYLIDMECLRVQLRDALAQNHESVSQIAEYRKAQDELERKMSLMRLELVEVIAARGKEQAENASQFENLQRKVTEEKFSLLKQEDRLMKANKKEFCCKYRILRKRSKHTSKLLAAMTMDHNRLIIRIRESEAQLAIAQMTRFHTNVGSAPSTGRTSLKVEHFSHGLFEADMKELAERQAKFLVQPSHPQG